MMDKKYTHHVFHLLLIVSVVVFGAAILHHYRVTAGQVLESPTDLGPRNLTQGDTVADTDAVTFSFTTRSDAPVGYEIQISSTEDYSSPVVDYMSPMIPAGSTLFTLGQSYPGDSYDTGSEVTLLRANNYYWRVKIFDGRDNDSAYTDASKGMAFVIDSGGGGDGDTTPPVIDTVAANPSDTSVIITWRTDEDATSQVEYGTTSNLDLSTDQADVDKPVTEHSVTMSGLLKCVAYYYDVVSVDASSNSATSEAGQFTTAGCPGAASVVDKSVITVSKDDGGSLSLFSSGKGISLTVPKNYVNTDGSRDFQIKKLQSTEVFSVIEKPSGYTAASSPFELHAINSDGKTVTTTFETPLTISSTYSDADVAGLDLTTLRIYRWDDGVWTALSNCTIDTNAKEVTCETNHFSTFALFGLPPGSNSGTSSSSTGNHAGGSSKVAIGDTTGGGAASAAPLGQQNSQYASFSRTLQFGNIGEEVLALQKYLNKHGFPLASTSYGSPGNETTFFGPLTRQALIRFQEAYADFILKPWGLSSGTGIFGERTRMYINAHP